MNTEENKLQAEEQQYNEHTLNKITEGYYDPSKELKASFPMETTHISGDFPFDLNNLFSM